MVYKDSKKNINIEAKNIILGNNIKFGRDINIKVRDTFKVGDNSIIGDRFNASGENIKLGNYFYNGPTDSRGMIIGGGSCKFPFANLNIGDGMVCHTGHINLASQVTIGNDVGLSHDVDIITHGFWSSVLDGYPRTFKEVKIGDNVIVGWKTIIMSGVSIANNIVIGANSTIVKSLEEEKAIYAGSPAKKIKNINDISLDEKVNISEQIIQEFKNLIKYYDVNKFDINLKFPYVEINNLCINLETKTYTGTHDEVTDAFRDFIRRFGIRIFNSRGFNFNLKRNEIF